MLLYGFRGVLIASIGRRFDHGGSSDNYFLPTESSRHFSYDCRIRLCETSLGFLKSIPTQQCRLFSQNALSRSLTLTIFVASVDRVEDVRQSAKCVRESRGEAIWHGNFDTSLVAKRTECTFSFSICI